MSSSLGYLERIDPRRAWPKEDENFTPWLASAEGLKLLGETLGYQLEREREEHEVGPFKADILARRIDTPDEHWVVIENQLEKTDHSHLGQALTYAAGLKAATIIWVATQFTEQHRAAIDWLNEITSEGFQFFGLEIELWQIGSSPLAPKLNIVARPNNWSRAISETKKSDRSPSPLQEQQRRYWEALRAFIVSRKMRLRPQKPSPQSWTNFALGRTNIWLCAVLYATGESISVECQMNGSTAPAWFAQLKAQKTQIDGEIGDPLEWDRKEGRDVHKVVLRRPSTDPTDESDWPRQHEWLARKLVAFVNAFGSRVRLLERPADTPQDRPRDVG